MAIWPENGLLKENQKFIPKPNTHNRRQQYAVDDIQKTINLIIVAMFA